MLDHLGHDDAARAVERAVFDDVAGRDGSQRKTREIGDAIAARVG